MMTVQRQVGKLLHRSTDESQVSILLKDFEEADKMLDKVSLYSKKSRQLINQTNVLSLADRVYESMARCLGLHP